MMRFVIFILFFSFSAKAIVLDWTGSYQVEFNVLQSTDFEQWGPGEFFHNLHLKPDIKAFDGVRVKSWFYLAGQRELSLEPAQRTFYPQEGIGFGLKNKDFPPGIFIRDLYLEVAHDFGFFQTGWKPHHFGLGLYYNDGSAPFSPAYNAEGSTGFLSWRGFIGSSYYVQPMLHYIGDALFNLFVQAGYHKEQYGIELMYKTSPQGARDLNAPITSPSYWGVYGYYKADTLSAKLEGGRTADELYGMALAINWQSPVSWLNLALDAALSTSDTNNKAFYFDPSFSSGLSFIIENYEERKQAKSKEGAHSGYAFHSAFHFSPSLAFSLSDSVELTTLFSVQLSYSDWEVLLYHTEMGFQYQLMEGLIWKTGLGAVFPQQESPYIGFISQAAISF